MGVVHEEFSCLTETKSLTQCAGTYCIFLYKNIEHDVQLVSSGFKSFQVIVHWISCVLSCPLHVVSGQSEEGPKDRFKQEV